MIIELPNNDAATRGASPCYRAMNVKQLLAWLISLYQGKDKFGDPDITARLVWRDTDGCPCRVEYAQFGFCSGLRPELTIEMSTATSEGLRPEDEAINNVG